MFHASAQVSHPCVWISRYGCGGSNIWGWRRSVIYFIESVSRDVPLESDKTARGRASLERLTSHARAWSMQFSVILRGERGDSSAPVLRHLHLSVRPPSHDADCRSLTGHALCRSGKPSTERALAYWLVFEFLEWSIFQSSKQALHIGFISAV